MVFVSVRGSEGAGYGGQTEDGQAVFACGSMIPQHRPPVVTGKSETLLTS
jgi:hypothetical protein